MTSSDTHNRMEAEIQHYLQAGEHDMIFRAWPAAENIIERMSQGHRDLL